MAPGIDLRFDGLPGYTEAAADDDAACLEGGRADAAAAPPARGDGGWRHGLHRGAGQSVPLPARPLRAREPDRALPEDQEAEVEGDHPRRQGCLLQAAPVPERLEGALSGPPRMGVAVAGRQGECGRCRRQDAGDRLRQPQGDGRQRHPAAARGRDRAERGRRRPLRLVPGRSGDVRVEARAEHPRDRRCRHHGRDAEVGLLGQRAGQGLRRGGRDPARRRARRPSRG